MGGVCIRKSFFEKSSVVLVRLNNKLIEILLIDSGIDFDDPKDLYYEYKDLYALGKVLSEKIGKNVK